MWANRDYEAAYNIFTRTYSSLKVVVPICIEHDIHIKRTPNIKNVKSRSINLLEILMHKHKALANK